MFIHIVGLWDKSSFDHNFDNVDLARCTRIMETASSHLTANDFFFCIIMFPCPPENKINIYLSHLSSSFWNPSLIHKCKEEECKILYSFHLNT